MKKPNITEGKWEVVSKRTIGIPYEQVDIVYCHGNEADSKAIAQVPNMIDELIESNKLLSELLGIIIEPEAVKLLKEQYENNKQVLTDAGCEL